MDYRAGLILRVYFLLLKSTLSWRLIGQTWINGAPFPDLFANGVTPMQRRVFPIARSIVMILAMRAAGALGQDTGAAATDFGAKINAAIQEIAAQPLNSHDAMNALRELPSESVLNAVTLHLQSDARFRQTVVRNLAYALLDHHRAEVTLNGVQQLVIGMRECGAGARALARLGPNAPAEVVTAVGDRLRETVASPNDELLRALGAFGSAARPHIDTVMVVLDNVELSETTRYNALEAMVKIGGTGFLLRELDETDARDAATQRIILWGMAYFGSKTHGTYDTDAAPREKIQRFVLEALRSENKGIREAAFEAMVPAFGEDALIIHSATDYQWNPRFIEPLRALAAGDTDGELRARVTKALEELDLDRAAANVLRKRQEQTQNAPPEK